VAAGCPGGDAREISRLLEAWSAVQPWEALAFVHGAPQFRGRSYAYRIPLARLAEISPDEMLAWVRQELPDDMREDVMVRSLRHLGETRPDLAIELAVRHVPENPHLTSQMLEHLAARDPVAASDWFERLGTDARKASAADLALAWLRKDRARATAWCLAQQGQPWAGRVMRALADHLASTAPSELPAILASPGLSPELRLNAIRRLSDSEPALALELAAALPIEMSHTVVADMFEQLFLDSPDSAVELARSALAPEEFSRRVRMQWSRWCNSDRPAALAWAASATDPEVRRQIGLELQTQSIRRDPAAYLSATTPGTGSPDHPELLQLALSRLAETDPDQAVVWSRIHGATLTADGASSIGARLADNNPTKVLPWLQALPAGAARDAACATVAEIGAGGKDVAAFAHLIGMIGDPVLQTRATFRTYQVMFARNTAAAEQWLALQPIGEDVRTSWQAIVETGEMEPDCFIPRY
jgi:hypothetical protein